MQLKKIRVYGKLRKFLGSSYFEAAVSSPAEAVRFLLCNYPEVEEHMCKQYYKIKMNNNDITLDFLSMKGKGDIQIIPVATGSGPLFAIVGSVVSAGVAVVSTAGAIAAEVGTSGVIGSIATAVVTDVAVEGITSLIAPTPEIAPPVEVVDPIPQNDVVVPDQRAQNSFGFSAITNISRAGVAVPIIYGEVFTGSVVISAGIDTVQIEGTAE